MSTSDARSWTTFWAHGQGASCLPQSRDSHEQLARAWTGFAAGLPPGARVIDLACGSGAAAHWLRSARRDLVLVGVDFADVRAHNIAGFELHSGVRLEQLPFAESSFDGAVSQFGIEYADRDQAIHEAGRILRPGAPFAFVMHHAESPVVIHNREREQALAKLIAETVERAFVEGDSAALGAAFSALRSEYPRQDVIGEFELGLGEAVRQAPGERSKTWQRLALMVRHERDILSALSQVAIADCGPWLESLDRFFLAEPASVIRSADGRPLAWLLTGRRR